MNHRAPCAANLLQLWFEPKVSESAHGLFRGIAPRQKVFGRSIDFLQTATQTYLEDPIWDKLQQGMAYTIVFKNCSVILPSQEHFEGCPIHHVPLAVHVPMNPEEIVAEGAFAGVPRLRYVSVELGIRLIGAEAWQNCRQLRIATSFVTANY